MSHLIPITSVGLLLILAMSGCFAPVSRPFSHYGFVDYALSPDGTRVAVGIAEIGANYIILEGQGERQRVDLLLPDGHRLGALAWIGADRIGMVVSSTITRLSETHRNSGIEVRSAVYSTDLQGNLREEFPAGNFISEIAFDEGRWALVRSGPLNALHTEGGDFPLDPHLWLSEGQALKNLEIGSFFSLGSLWFRDNALFLTITRSLDSSPEFGKLDLTSNQLGLQKWDQLVSGQGYIQAGARCAVAGTDNFTVPARPSGNANRRDLVEIANGSIKVITKVPPLTRDVCFSPSLNEVMYFDLTGTKAKFVREHLVLGVRASWNV